MTTDYEFDFELRNRFALMVPFVVLLPLALASLLSWWRVRAIGSLVKGTFTGNPLINIGELKQNQRRVWLLCFRIFNMILKIMFVPAASRALSLFDCSIEADGYYYMDAEPSSRCYTPKWENNFAVSCLGIIGYVIGIPMYFILLYFSLYQTSRTSSFWLRRKQNAEVIVNKQGNHLKPDFQHFVVVEIIQKFGILLVRIFFTRYVPVQTMLINLILMGYLVFIVRYLPYKYRNLNQLELLCSGSSIFVLNIGLLFYTFEIATLYQINILTGIALFSIYGSILLVVIAAVYEGQRSLRQWGQTRRKSVVQGVEAVGMAVA